MSLSCSEKLLVKLANLLDVTTTLVRTTVHALVLEAKTVFVPKDGAEDCVIERTVTVRELLWILRKRKKEKIK